MYKRDVEREHIATEEGGDLRKKNGDVIRPAGIDRRANVGSDKEGICAKTTGVLWARVSGIAFRMQMDQLDILELRCPPYEGLEKYLGRGSHAVNENAVSGFNHFYGFGCGKRTPRRSCGGSNGSRSS